MDPNELQTKSMPANHFQDPQLYYYRSTTEPPGKPNQHNTRTDMAQKDYYGCKDKLLIDIAILENHRMRKSNLLTSLIDYKKASDSIPHES